MSILQAVHESAPDAFHPVLGWRAWRWTDRGLESLFFAERWTPRSPAQARCPLSASPDWPERWRRAFELRHPPERLIEVPSETCDCGIYAAARRDQASDYGQADFIVLGRVALWGRIVRHETGWRAEFAYPQSLFVPDHLVSKARDALWSYGVPILRRSAVFEDTGELRPAS